MAANSQAVKSGAYLPDDSQPSFRRQFIAAVASLPAVLIGGCAKEPELKAEYFVGVWRSSRMASRPLHLLASGDWEIRDHGSDKPLQYGVWELQGRVLIWTMRLNGAASHDRNRIESVEPARFTLREQGGSITYFERLK